MFTSPEKAAHTRKAYDEFKAAIAKTKYADRHLPWTVVEDPAKAKEVGVHCSAI